MTTRSSNDPRTLRNSVLMLMLMMLMTAAVAGSNIECPFPEGQGVSSESECARYSACVWSGNACHMQDAGQVGYTVTSDPVPTQRGFKVDLQLQSRSKTLFDADIEYLECEVFYHEDYHVQVKIRDSNSSRYEVPVPLTMPEVPGSNPTYSVQVASIGQPFYFSITRTSTGVKVFSTYGPLSYEDQFIQLTTELPSTYLYGFGENTHLSLRHEFEPRRTWPIFARDQPTGQSAMNTYGSHPYYSVVEDDEGNTHSVLFFNSNAMEYSTFLLDDGSPALTLRTIGGIVDLHVFLGPSPEEVNTQYTSLVGRPAFPPYRTLGFQLSRYGYTSTDDVRAVRSRMADAGIPQDVQTIDIDYMDHFRDFTYDKGAWVDLPQLIDELHDDNLTVTLILDPALVIDWDNYPPSRRGRDADVFIKWMSPDLVPEDQPVGANDYVVGYVWPDEKTVFPDFLNPATQEWWGNELSLLHQELAYDAIWIDMDEPANFGTDMDKPWNWPEGQEPWSLKCPYNRWDSPPYPTMTIRVGGVDSARISDKTICMSSAQTDGLSSFLHYNTHSLYGWSETVATFRGLESVFPGRRPVVLSRSTFPGSGQFVVHWLGDNTADWTQMAMSIIGMIEFNMFGLPMVGADICGFIGAPSVELCARWMQLGAFYPFSRNHNAINEPDQDPASDPTLAAISRDVLRLRYRYLPYLYTLFHKAHMHGNSVVRPLYNAYPQDLNCRDVDDQFLWGAAVMVAPVLSEGATSRPVYFPQGLWYDLVSGELESSRASTQSVDAPLEKIPVYVRGGSILPTQGPALTTRESRLNPFGLTIALDGTLAAAGDLFYDSGDQEHDMDDSYMATFSYTEGELRATIKHGEQLVSHLMYDNFEIYGCPSSPSGITLNGAQLPSAAWNYNGVSSVLQICVEVPLAEEFTLVIV